LEQMIYSGYLEIVFKKLCMGGLGYLRSDGILLPND